MKFKKKSVGIIATIGPSSFSPKIMDQMADAGMVMGRINTKYGDEKEWERNISYLKNSGVKVMVDIKTEKNIPWLKNQDVDYVAVSFAETAKHILNVKKHLNKGIRIISKIETLKAIKNLKELMAVSDGIMVARGDLGRNVSLEKVPIFQKLIIKKCNQKKKIVITATEMLLSMVKSQIPERAEVSDVANAVLDGSDFLMLSEETTIGKNPVAVVGEMRKIIDATFSQENLLNFK
jgi:pyruvate kinase